MSLHLSNFGERLTRSTGIHALMDDLGRALAGPGEVLMMGGGNPARIPAVQAVWRRRMRELSGEGGGVDRVLSDYSPPQGYPAFIEALAHALREACGWPVTAANIAVTSGSQQAFFFLLNMFSGVFPDGGRRRILFPLMPEYIGYADQALEAGQYLACRPEISEPAPHCFKYHIDVSALPRDDSIGALCVSRPTNPTANVLTDGELAALVRHAEALGVPLIVDNAYGAPFPGILFGEAHLPWTPCTIYVFSLSKLGLPGVRTGIVVASEEIIEALSMLNANVSLAIANVGPALVAPLLATGELFELCRSAIRPFYEQRMRHALEWIAEAFPDDLPYQVHAAEGAFFLWLRFKDLPITTLELYQRLKARGLIVVPGRYFIYGLPEPWAHGDECLRLSYAQPEGIVRAGIRTLAREVAAAYTA